MEKFHMHPCDKLPDGNNATEHNKTESITNLPSRYKCKLSTWSEIIRVRISQKSDLHIKHKLNPIAASNSRKIYSCQCEYLNDFVWST